MRGGELSDAGTYSVEVNGDGAIGINDGLFTLELGDFSYDAYMLAYETVEVGGGDARGGKLFRHGGMGNWRIRFRDQMGIGFGGETVAKRSEK